MPFLYSAIAAFLIIFGSSASAQHPIGVVLSDELPLPYVNISVLHSSLRTVSDLDGKFFLDLSQAHREDTVAISYVGYQTMLIRVSEFLDLGDTKVISLTEEVLELSEVVVAVDQVREKILGNHHAGKLVQVGFSSVGLGDQIGSVIRIKKSPTFIETLHIKTNYITNDSMLFRLNFYEVEKGLPSQKIVTPLITFSSKELLAEAVFDIDLTPYQIVMTDDFFFSLECIENRNPDGKIIFAGSLGHGPIIGKLQEDADWQKHAMFGVGFYLTTKY